MISFEDALSHVAQNAISPAIEQVALPRALGRRLAAPAAARLTQPPFHSSAMDGYAVRLADVKDKGARLTVIGEAPAGAPFFGQVQSGQAVRIFTGSEIPAGADTVIIQEDVTRHGDHITIDQPMEMARHIRRAGQDFAQGDVLVQKGERLSPAHVMMLAAGNIDALSVFASPRVAILANGDELRDVGADVKPGQIINANGPGLTALLQSWGCTVIDGGILPDNQSAIEDKIDSLSDCDVLLPIGGASVGDHDYMKAAFAARGFEPVFSKVAMRPGKPVWLSRRGAQRVLGLPGNPASAFVCAHIFLPLLLGWQKGLPLMTARLSHSLGENGPRAHFMRARVEIDDNAQAVVTPFPSQDSALIRPLAAGNALIYRPLNAPALTAGALAQILRLD